jgi:4-hydroxy-4-methyl-2-oxoglutarate aldolase
MDNPIQRLGRLDCCAVSDAMDKLGLKGSVSGLEQRSTTRRIAGRVVTYRLVAADQATARPGPPRHLGTTAVEQAAPGDVIVVEQRTGIDAGCWGGILSLGAKVRGIAGVIADGPVRDIDEARAYDFPVYARALTARTARGRVAEAESGQPVSIGDVRVAQGDYVIAGRGRDDRRPRGRDGQGAARRPAHRAGDGRRLRTHAALTRLRSTRRKRR